MLCSMQDDIVCQFEQFITTKQMCLVYKDKFGGMPMMKLRRSTIKLDSYRKRYQLAISQHLWEIANNIREIKSIEYEFTYKQKIQVVISSLPQSWEHMRINMTLLLDDDIRLVQMRLW